jgi:isocitrate dehydrogenase
VKASTFAKIYNMSNLNQTIAVAKGDGIGAEIMDAVLNIFNAAKVPLNYAFVDMGKKIYEEGNSTGMTATAKGTVEKLGILFKGPMETPKGKGVKSINVTARKVWNTYANKRVFKTLSGVDTVFSRAGIPIDITIVRENIEDTYGGIEHMLTQDVALCRRFITRPGCLQVHKYAFEMAKKKNAKRITCGHKANIMKITDGLFLETFYEVAKDYPMLKADDVIVDDLCMKLVVKPNEFDVVVLPNLQGDIVSDLCAGLIGGLGFAPSANIGDDICIFEAVHGTAPDIVGKGIANPTALLLSGLMMLRHLGLSNYSKQIENALFKTLQHGLHTLDFGNKQTEASSTNDFVKAIISNLGDLPINTVVISPIASKNIKNESDSINTILIQSSIQKKQELVGVDYFIEFKEQPLVLATLLQPFLKERYTLSTISNRGTQVWPSGSNFTNCVNQYRVRFEKNEKVAITEDDIFELSKEISKKVRICSLEMLLKIDDKKAYTLAQGQ